ncbi:MAG: AAA family ATPase [Ignavibacteria bacterium]|nr:AAA family ATPase [Ignavibacteria bacterium]
MSIKKIISITNMAVFKNFDWDKNVRDKGNNKIEFKKLNILYGRNYSGKTTLSRIVRALETHKISDKYIGVNFQIDIEGDGIFSLSNLNAHTQTVRVFNEDFVKDNLRFLINESEDIQSFAILGEKNIEIEAAIASKEIELGTEEPSTGLLGEQKAQQSFFTTANIAVGSKQQELENLLKRKANEEIKQNPDYKDVNYNINKIKTDIDKIITPSFKDIDPVEVPKLRALLKDEPKQKITEVLTITLSFPELVDGVKALIEKKITLSNPIKALLEDSLLESWVRSGIAHHKDKRTTCGFCGSVLPSDLMTNLDKHFNKESEELRSKLESLIVGIEGKEKGFDKILSFDVSQFYASEKDSIFVLEKKYKEFVKDYRTILQKLIAQLKERLDSISTPCVFKDCTDITGSLVDIIIEYNKIIKQTNEKTTSFSKSQNEARNGLRLHEVNTFLNTIRYSDKNKEIAKLEGAKRVADTALQVVKSNVSLCKSKINELKTQLKDEKKGAEQVNKYLNNYFGHNALKLEPIDAVSESGMFKFEIQRDGKKAYHLSRGECSLVSFCYFMAKLNDISTKGNEPIIWIDDPISSLDANHVFFIYSLIKSEIVKTNKFKQLFISTHNLDFLKYLKRLVDDRDYGKKMLNFIIQRKGDESTIFEMPEYMVKYVTEFNYLFHKIYQCANTDIETIVDSTLFYDFGNNARKFLELLLAFKFPNPSISDDKKLECFLGESSVESTLVNRIINEYSHLFGVFERGITPIEIPEMKKTAKFILNKVYENDKDQYNSLLESIGEAPITSGEKF